MRLLAALLWFALIAAAAPAAAQTAIQRCIGANGNPVFTDQPCAALQATPLNPAARPSSASNLAGPPSIQCAANLGELKQSVIEAFANHDANRLAGLMLWSGYGHRAVVADIRALSVALRQSLLDFGPDDSLDSASADSDLPAAAVSTADASFTPSAPLAPSVAPPPSNRLVLHTTGNDGRGSPHALRFTIVRRSGCLWLRNAD